ncbi:unnamed protein product [Protopolystoma xenopodis]|uniref:Pyroglutamyl-peptidase I n=1 Tax=Protopolystoma xenopodis TaxID=117903 RepID=A0A448XJF0_9PLAT|nr:unnamed protein product [Protopolystoma xenopodis]
MRVFVTSFGPFGDHKVNPSSQAVKKLKEIWESRSELSGSDLELNTITDVQDLVIHVGLNACSTSLNLETRAFNSYYDSPDINMSYCGCDGFCVPGGPQEILCGLNLKRTCDLLCNSGNPCELSDDPHTFLCGFIYYLSLSRNRGRCAFLHVPCISNFWTQDRLAEALILVAQDLTSQIMMSNSDISSFE